MSTARARGCVRTAASGPDTRFDHERERVHVYGDGHGPGHAIRSSRYFLKKRSKARRIAPRLEFLNRHLEGREWVLDTFSILDIYALYSARGVKARGFDLARWPNVAALHDRVAARQSFKDAVAAGA